MERLAAIPPLYRWLAIPVGVVLLAGLYYMLLYQAYAEEMSAVQEKIEAGRKTVEKYTEIAVKLEPLRAQVSDLEARLQGLLRELPGSKEIPDLIKRISELVVRTGLRISLFKPQPEQRKEFYAEIPIQMRVQGPYHSVGRFFDDLAHLERIVSVDSVQMEATSQETQCLATTFRFLDEAETHEATATAKKTK